MKNVMLLSALACLASTAVSAEEIRYEQSGLGYRELASGQNELAIQRLEASKLSAKDAAQLINLGRAYVRTGQYDRAAQAFRAAMNSGSQYDVRLADGRMMSSQEAARLSLEQIEGRIAVR